MADVEIAVGLGRKSGHDLSCLPRRQILADDLADEIRVLGVDVSLSSSLSPSRSHSLHRAQHFDRPCAAATAASLPSTAMVSNSGGVAVRPVTAIRTGMNSCFGGPFAAVAESPQRRPRRLRLPVEDRIEVLLEQQPEGLCGLRRGAVLGHQLRQRRLVVLDVCRRRRSRRSEEVLEGVDSLLDQGQDRSRGSRRRGTSRATVRAAPRVEVADIPAVRASVSFVESKTGPPRLMSSSSKLSTNSSRVNWSRSSGMAHPSGAR